MPTRRRRHPHTAAQLIRRRRWMRWGAITALLILGCSSALDNRGAFKYRGDDWANFDRQTCVVTKVVDGDTVDVRPANGGAVTRVRLLGVDAPELHDRETNKPDYWADRSTGYLQARAGGKAVVVRVEPTKTRDKYGRLLAYLYLGDNENLNLSLVRDGQAYADRRFAHTYKAQFEQEENGAREKGRGLWKAVTFDQQPQWRRKWLSELRAGKGKP